MIILTSILHAPLIFEITETSTFSGPPSIIKLDIGDDLIEGLIIVY